MFIVWGTKVVRKPRGRRADFCTLCRDFKPFRVVEVRTVGHVYYIPLGRGQTQGFEETCESCRLARVVDASAGQPATSNDRHADVETLLFDTNPDARRDWAGRLALEGRVRSNTLTPEERPAAVLEPFLLTEGLLASRTSATQFDAASGMGCLASLVAFFGIMTVGMSLVRTNKEQMIGIAGMVAGVLAVFTLVLLATDGRRYARRVILPVLARALRPLRPTPEEIDAAREALKARGGKLGKVLKTDEIVDALSFVAE
jgi:hypothetical protein